jgi:hypothetical protein
MQTNTQPEADAVAKPLTDPTTQDVNEELDHEIDGVPPMGRNGTDMLDEVPDQHADLDTYVPTDDEEKKIALVTDAGAEYKTLHVKLTKLFDQCRPWVQDLKDNVFRVRQGTSGRAVVISGVALSWEEYCQHTFGVGARRINQLLEIDDRKDDRNVLPPVKKLHLTHEQLEAMLDAKYEEGISAGAEGVKDDSDADDEDETEAGAPEDVRKLEDVINNSPVPEGHNAAGEAYEYFEQFKDEPETMGTEISAMLFDLGLDYATIKQVLRIVEKDAATTCRDLEGSGRKK